MPRMMRVALGLGFRAGVTAVQLDAAIRAALARHPGAQPVVVATLDAKRGARALRRLCARRGWPLVGFGAAQLATRPELAASGPSAAALARFGVAGVAEPCAQLAAPHGRLLGPKLAHDGVTVALAGPL
jgi:cobalt-precorrin 5A hydrolase